jgi:hypothetical protein
MTNKQTNAAREDSSQSILIEYDGCYHTSEHPPPTHTHTRTPTRVSNYNNRLHSTWPHPVGHLSVTLWGACVAGQELGGRVRVDEPFAAHLVPHGFWDVRFKPCAELLNLRARVTE